MMKMTEPNVVNVIEPEGEISDEMDYLVNMKVMEQIGAGFTACQPSLVEIERDGETTQAIKMGLDHTFVDSDSGQVMGYGIVGHIFMTPDLDDFEIYYITPKEILDEKVEYIMENDIEPEPRPRGKY